VLQPPEPATALELPLSLFIKAANVETARLAPFLQVGQGASSLALLMGRRSSNLTPHLGQQYSYIGIPFLQFDFIPLRTASQFGRAGMAHYHQPPLPPCTPIIAELPGNSFDKA